MSRETVAGHYQMGFCPTCYDEERCDGDRFGYTIHFFMPTKFTSKYAYFDKACTKCQCHYETTKKGEIMVVDSVTPGRMKLADWEVIENHVNLYDE